MGDIFKAIEQPTSPELLVGFEASDDSAIFRLDEKTALVQSLDFFSPIVDDPVQFGAIAAANSLSDIYAMGGRPITALTMLCFPYTTVDTDILARISRGGSQKIRESGALVVGGHSVLDSEVKFGYAVTGLVDPNLFWRNNTPQEGDALLLTKPLGTGLIATAVKQNKLPASYLNEPTSEMMRLNKLASELAAPLTVHACTDITGFGLMGHLFEMCRSQSMGALLKSDAIAVFNGVWQAIEAGALTRAHGSNREYLSDYAADSPALEKFGDILFDPQTSGGLLLAMPPVDAQTLKKALVAQGHHTSLVGHITSSPEIRCV